MVIGKDKAFTFDYVFDQPARQRDIYHSCVEPLVNSFLEGFNSTILAYGQTGSGKTFTVGTSNILNVPDQELGVIPRIVRSLFDSLAKRRASTPHYEASLKVSFLEIYGEDVRDLLAGGAGSGRSLSVRETDAGVSVLGASEMRCEDESSMLGALETGSVYRATGSTMMNAHSSRSHAVFTIVLDQKIPYLANDGPAIAAESTEAAAGAAAGGLPTLPQNQSSGKVRNPDAIEHRVSKFHILDLAGSERAKRTQAVGKRLQEGININLGLLALGNVISALGDDEKRKKGNGALHVPYRDSKLTHMLKDSLGGNSQTLMIACVSPAESNFDESLNTLRYASRARNIKNRPVINRDANASTIAQLKAEVEALRAQLQSGSSGPEGSASSSSSIAHGAGLPSHMAEQIQSLLQLTGERDINSALDKITMMRADADEALDLRMLKTRDSILITDLREQLQRALQSEETASKARNSAETQALVLNDRIRKLIADVDGANGGSVTADAILQALSFDAPSSAALQSTEALIQRLHVLEAELEEWKARARDDYRLGAIRNEAIDASLIVGAGAASRPSVARPGPRGSANGISSAGAAAASNAGVPTAGVADSSEGLAYTSKMMDDFGISEDEILAALNDFGGEHAESAELAERSVEDDDDAGLSFVDLTADSTVAVTDGGGNPRSVSSAGNAAGNAVSASASDTALQEFDDMAEGRPQKIVQAQREHRRRQHMMRGHLQELDSNIDAKQKLQDALRAKQSELESVRMQYEKRFAEEKAEKEELEARISSLRKQLEDSKHLTEEERQRLQSKLKEQLMEYERKLRETNAKLRDYDSFARIRSRTEAEIVKLQEEIAGMKRAKVAQVAVMRSERARFDAEQTQRKKELAALQRENAAVSSALARLQAEDAKKDVVLKQKHEDLLAAKRKIRDMEIRIGTSSAAAAHAASSQGRASILMSSSTGAGALAGSGTPSGDTSLSLRSNAVAAFAKSVKAAKSKRLQGTGTIRSATRGAASSSAGGRRAAATVSVDDSREAVAEVQLRFQLEAAAAKIAEEERRVEELERRLKAREEDVKMLESLIEQRDRIRRQMLSEQQQVNSDAGGDVASPGQAGKRAPKGRLVLDDVDRAAGFDQTLLDDINSFFQSSSAASSPMSSDRVGDDSSRVDELDASSAPAAGAHRASGTRNPSTKPSTAPTSDVLSAVSKQLASRSSDSKHSTGDDTDAKQSDPKTAVLEELDERIESAQARLEYQDARILNLAEADEVISKEIGSAIQESKENAAGGTKIDASESSASQGAPAELSSLLAPTNLDEAHLALRVLFDMVIGLKNDDRSRQSSLQEAEYKIRELSALLESSDAQMKAVRLEGDRRLADARREAVAESDVLLRLGAAAAAAAGGGDNGSGTPMATTHSLLRAGGVTGVGAASAAGEDNQVIDTTPSELLDLLRKRSEQHSNLEEQLRERDSTIKELAMERDRLRKEINHLTRKDLRTQETMHRRKSREESVVSPPADAGGVVAAGSGSGSSAAADGRPGDASSSQPATGAAAVAPAAGVGASAHIGPTHAKERAEARAKRDAALSGAAPANASVGGAFAAILAAPAPPAAAAISAAAASRPHVSTAAGAAGSGQSPPASQGFLSVRGQKISNKDKDFGMAVSSSAAAGDVHSSHAAPTNARRRSSAGNGNGNGRRKSSLDGSESSGTPSKSLAPRGSKQAQGHGSPSISVVSVDASANGTEVDGSGVSGGGGGRDRSESITNTRKLEWWKERGVNVVQPAIAPAPPPPVPAAAPTRSRGPTPVLPTLPATRSSARLVAAASGAGAVAAADSSAGDEAHAHAAQGQATSKAVNGGNGGSSRPGSVVGSVTSGTGSASAGVGPTQQPGLGHHRRTKTAAPSTSSVVPEAAPAQPLSATVAVGSLRVDGASAAAAAPPSTFAQHTGPSSASIAAGAGTLAPHLNHLGGSSYAAMSGATFRTSQHQQQQPPQMQSLAGGSGSAADLTAGITGRSMQAPAASSSALAAAVAAGGGVNMYRTSSAASMPSARSVSAAAASAPQPPTGPAAVPVGQPTPALATSIDRTASWTASTSLATSAAVGLKAPVSRLSLASLQTPASKYGSGNSSNGGGEILPQSESARKHAEALRELQQRVGSGSAYGAGSALSSSSSGGASMFALPIGTRAADANNNNSSTLSGTATLTATSIGLITPAGPLISQVPSRPSSAASANGPGMGSIPAAPVHVPASSSSSTSFASGAVLHGLPSSAVPALPAGSAQNPMPSGAAAAEDAVMDAPRQAQGRGRTQSLSSKFLAGMAKSKILGGRPSPPASATGIDGAAGGVAGGGAGTGSAGASRSNSRQASPEAAPAVGRPSIARSDFTTYSAASAISNVADSDNGDAEGKQVRSSLEPLQIQTTLEQLRSPVKS